MKTSHARQLRTMDHRLWRIFQIFWLTKFLLKVNILKYCSHTVWRMLVIPVLWYMICSITMDLTKNDSFFFYSLFDGSWLFCLGWNIDFFFWHWNLYTQIFCFKGTSYFPHAKNRSNTNCHKSQDKARQKRENAS